MSACAAILLSLIAATSGHGDARLEIELAHASMVVGEAPLLTIRLRNTSAGRLWVNTRFGVNSESAVPDFRDVWFDIVGPDGRRLNFDCQVKGRLATASDYRIVQPGDWVGTVDSLSCFKIGLPGTYRIAVKYRDGNSTPPPAPLRSVHLTEQIESNQVQLRVLPSTP